MVTSITSINYSTVENGVLKGSTLLALWQLVHQIATSVLMSNLCKKLYRYPSIAYFVAGMVVPLAGIVGFGMASAKNETLKWMLVAFSVLNFIVYFVKRSKATIQNKEASYPFFLTDMAADENKQDYFIGNEKRVRQLELALRSSTYSQAIIYGKTGIGKTALIKQLVLEQKQGKISEGSFFYGKRIFKLDLTRMYSGTEFVSAFEGRVLELVKFTESNPDVLIFIDEVHQMMSLGRTNFNLQGGLAEKLKVYIESEQIRIIGATTDTEVKILQNDSALKRRFNFIEIEESSAEECLTILKSLLKSDSRLQTVQISDDILNAIIEKTNGEDRETGQPHKAIALLREFVAWYGMQNPTPTSVEDGFSIFSNKDKNKKSIPKNFVLSFGSFPQRSDDQDGPWASQDT